MTEKEEQNTTLITGHYMLNPFWRYLVKKMFTNNKPYKSL